MNFYYSHTFALSLNGYWQLLPAVYRYLEHFESLSASGQDDSFDEPQGGEEDESAEVGLDEEEEA